MQVLENLKHRPAMPCLSCLRRRPSRLSESRQAENARRSLGARISGQGSRPKRSKRLRSWPRPVPAAKVELCQYYLGPERQHPLLQNSIDNPAQRHRPRKRKGTQRIATLRIRI